MRWKRYPGGLLSPNIEDRRGETPTPRQRRLLEQEAENMEQPGDIEVAPYYVPPFDEPGLQETAVSPEQQRLYELAQSRGGG
jgi:hypothetical protein